MKPDAPAPLWLLSPLSALVVEPSDADSGVITAALMSAGYAVAVTHNYNDAKALLGEAPPTLLVTEVRLGAYNGLQLAYRGRSSKPYMTIVLTSGYGDPVLQRDAERIGATFVVKPLTAQEFIAAIYRTAMRQPNPDGTCAPVQPPFERRLADRRQSSMSGVFDIDRRRAERRRTVPLGNRVALST